MSILSPDFLKSKKQVMIQWEYKVVKLNVSLGAEEDFLLVLNKYGKDGWENYDVMTIPNTNFSVYHFKRPIPDKTITTKTKEEILQCHKIEFDVESNWLFDGDVSQLFKAMDEYAKQQGCAFADWLQFNYQPHAEKGHWYNHHDDQTGKYPFPTAHLYNEYLTKQHQSQP